MKFVAPSPSADAHPPAPRTVEFVTAPDLTDVDDEDKELVELTSIVALKLQTPRVICAGWRVVTHDTHYLLEFELTPNAGPMTEVHLRTIRELNLVRIVSVWLKLTDGHLNLVVKIARSGTRTFITDELLIHMARVCRRGAEPEVGTKRARFAEH